LLPVLADCSDSLVKIVNDRFGACHTTSVDAVVNWYEGAVYAVGAHRPIGSALQNVLSLDPGFIAAHALLGLANVILARTETQVLAEQYRRAAIEALAHRDGGTASERALVRALDLSCSGHMRWAADGLEQHLERHPTDFLAFKIAHSMRFMCGQITEMLALTRRVVPNWTSSDGGYGFVLGCHAFALEESGYYGEAEILGRRAYAHEAEDAWGLHAVSHVMEMSNRTAEGIEFLSTSRTNWTQCNNFAFHIGWHLALFHLDRGDVGSVLDLYDRDIRATQTDDFRDMANAASLLWRLEQEGVDVGARWAALHDIASRRRLDTTYVFASLHYLMVLVARGDTNGAADVMGALSERAKGTGDQAEIAAHIGVPLAGLLAGIADKAGSGRDLPSLAGRLQGLGGSHAQRDVFLRSLLAMACKNGDNQGLVALSRIRHALRSSDRFMRMIDHRCGPQAEVRASFKSGGELAF
jgi:hypothetical protein